MAVPKYTTAQRLQQIMDSKSLKQVDIINMAKPFCEKYGVKLGKNSLSQYVNGSHKPTQDKLTILGLALNVSELWLMGFDVPEDRKIALIEPEDDEREEEFIQLYRSLSPEKQVMVVQMLRGLSSN